MLSLLGGVTLDHLLGEPRRAHPLVAFGRLAARLEQHLNLATAFTGQQRLHGGFALLVLVLPPTLLACWLSSNLVVAALLLYLCLGRRALREHLQPIAAALEQHDLVQARALVARIVSRDCDDMDEAQITRAAIESALENGLDAIFATLFWFVVAGPAGAVLHRLVNTLDAMWGYRTPRFAGFGWAAAKLDDVMGFVPARLTALTYALLGNVRAALHSWRTQAAGMASPNGGPVMCAGAGGLDLQLGGPASYHGAVVDKPWFGTQRPPTVADIHRALALLDRSLLAWLVAIACGELLT